MSDTSTDAHAGGATLGGYLTGFVLALLLTIVPFGVVAFGDLSRGVTLITIAVAAVLQILVHLMFFLHLDFSVEHRNNTMFALFSALILFILVGGTVWLFYSLHYRTMVMPG